MPVIDSQPPPTIHPAADFSHRRGAKIVDQTFRRLEQALDVQSGILPEIKAQIIVGAGMSRAAGPRSAEGNRYDAGTAARSDETRSGRGSGDFISQNHRSSRFRRRERIVFISTGIPVCPSWLRLGGCDSLPSTNPRDSPGATQDDEEMSSLRRSAFLDDPCPTSNSSARRWRMAIDGSPASMRLDAARLPGRSASRRSFSIPTICRSGSTIPRSLPEAKRVSFVRDHFRQGAERLDRIRQPRGNRHAQHPRRGAAGDGAGDRGLESAS